MLWPQIVWSHGGGQIALAKLQKVRPPSLGAGPQIVLCVAADFQFQFHSDIAKIQAWRGFPRRTDPARAASVTFGTVAALKASCPGTYGEKF
jgi:hypothetical protein